MRLSADDQSRFPRFAYYVQHDIPRVMEVPSIVAAFREIGGINRGVLRAALQWNSGPLISIVSGLSSGGRPVCGSFTPAPGSNTLRVHEQLVTDFEAGRGVRQARAGRVYIVGVTLLHELVHWADNLNGVDRPGEEGWEFEQRVYGPAQMSCF